MTEDGLKTTRTPNNKLTAAEMFKLTREIETRVHGGMEPAESWKAAEEVYTAGLGRTVTRPNILTALSSLDDVSQSQVVRNRFASTATNGDLDSKFERLDGRISQLASDLLKLERLSQSDPAAYDRVSEGLLPVAECCDQHRERLDSIDEVLAREAARIDTTETWREATRAVTARHQAELGHLRQQNAVLAQRLKAIETQLGKPFAENSGGDFFEQQGRDGIAGE